ncbi:MAG: metal-dependent hydrolase [Magnetococcus sp. YQC-9]
MADFNTHLAVAAVAGGVVVTSLMVVGVIHAQAGLSCFFAAMVGGVLPDVDAEESWTLDLTFSIFALLGSFLIMFSQVRVYTIGELIVLWLVSFLFIKYAVCEMFIRCTVHRGIFHSLPAAVFFGGASAALLFHLFHQSERFAWIIGLFMFFGVLVHLVLDEIYSLNLMGEGGVARSFGSALKLWSSDPWASFTMYLAAGMVVLSTPGLPAVLKELFDRRILEAMLPKLFPSEVWFGIPYFTTIH